MDTLASAIKGTLHRWSWAGIALGVLLTSLSFLVAWRSMRQLSADDDWVSHTHAVRTAIEATLSHVTEIETGARGYAASGDTLFLESYLRGKHTIGKDIDILTSLTTDNGSQQRRMDLLKKQIDARLETADATVAAREKLKSVPPATFFREGQKKMDAVRATIAEMQAEEARFLEMRQKQAVETRIRTELFMLSSTIAGLLLLTVAGTITIREVKRSSNLITQIQILNEGLERRVEHRTAELKESQQQLRLFVEHAPAALAMFDRRMNYVQVSQRWLIDYGLDGQNVHGMSHYEVFPEMPQEWRDSHRRGLAGEVLRGESDRFERLDGTEHWIRWETRPWYESTGEIGGIVIFTEDITERKRVEDALRTSNARTRFSMEAAKLGDWQVDLKTMQTTRSLLHDQIFGYTSLLPEWGYETFLSHVHPDDREKVRQTFQSSVDHSMRMELECRIIRVDGEVRWIWACSDSQREVSGGANAMFGIVQDITDRKAAEGEVHRLNAELEQRVVDRTAQLEAANKELEAFTYSVSHDLRAPLRHISGFSRILLDDFATSLPDEAQHHLQRIDEGTRRMGQLVDELLNLARVGRRELTLQVVGLRSLVDEAIADLKPEVGSRNIEWKIGNLTYADCDAGLLKQVFHNLIFNAIKFTRPRQNATIEIGQKDHEGFPMIYVRDNGVGFSMKYADKLFGVFQRLHRAEDFEGTGVGLATVQRIVQKHGGRIWAEAELDQGATFYFTLGLAERKGVPTKAAYAGEGA